MRHNQLSATRYFAIRFEERRSAAALQNASEHCARNGGYVMECGGVPPLLDRRVALARHNPTDPETKLEH